VPVLAWISAAAAAQSIDDLGKSLSELDSSAYGCRASGSRTVCRRNEQDLMHLGLPALAVTLEYEHELLGQVTVMFDERYFADVEIRLNSSFGVAEPRDEKLRSGMAGILVNRVRVWRRASGFVMLEQFAEKVTRSALRYLTTAEYAALVQRRNAARIRGIRDL
jgi:hypothetical protein